MTHTKEYIKQESLAGILLFFSACIALIFANTPLNSYYELFIKTPVSVQISNFIIAKPLLLWINDGLMVLFFFLVGLELKREFLLGELSTPDRLTLPVVGAIGGMVFPALIYVYFNWHDPVALNGWAIPAATDIAFVLGVLSLLGKRVPTALKVFATTLAVIDDIAAIVIIAVFYTAQLSLSALYFSLLCIPLLALLNRLGVTRLGPYLLVGIFLWAALVKSGVHATLAGVILALFIPLKHPHGSLLDDAMEGLHPITVFFILPVFAFANSGVNIKGIGLDYLLHDIPFGIACGLFIGKQLGIFIMCWLTVKLGFARLPDKINWLSLYGVGVLCGIGFTMSLFISALAFEKTGVNSFFDERLGIMVGSLLSGFLGYLILRWSLPRS